MSLYSIATVFRKLFLTIFELPKNFIRRFYLVIIILLFGLFCTGITPLLLIDSLNIISENYESKTIFSIFFLLIAYSVVWTLSQITCVIVWLIWQRPSNRIASLICEKTLSKILEFPLQFYSTHESRNAITSIEKTFQMIPSIFSNVIIHVIPSITEMILSLGIFFYLYGFYYGMLLVVLFLGFILLTIFSVFMAKKIDSSYHTKLDNLSIHVSEIINNFEIVKAFSAEKYEIDTIKKHLLGFEHISKKRSFYLDGAQIMQTFFCGIILMIFTCSSGYSVYKGVMTPGDFILINTYFIQFAIPITFLGYIFSEVYKDISSLSSTFKLHDLKLDQIKSGDIKHIDKDNFSLKFSNVSVNCSEGHCILNNISFKIKNGQRLGLIGTSGSGKSTCIRLLLKLIEECTGSIEIGENNIKDIDTNYLRNNIGIVLQDNILFYGTIKENIIYNSENISNARLKEAIEIAGLTNFVNKLELGVNTSIEGINLSGGEKQKIAIARAVLREPNIYILDEPTSALDSQTELEVLNHINEVTKNKTTVIVTHKLLLVQNADCIIVLKEGKIIQVGTHDELMNKNGLYKNLWQQQCQI